MPQQSDPPSYDSIESRPPAYPDCTDLANDVLERLAREKFPSADGQRDHPELRGLLRQRSELLRKANSSFTDHERPTWRLRYLWSRLRDYDIGRISKTEMFKMIIANCAQGRDIGLIDDIMEFAPRHWEVDHSSEFAVRIKTREEEKPWEFWLPKRKRDE